MIDIYDELKALTASLERHAVDYAMCGGLAMAVHGYVRATLDIDLLILAGDLSRVVKIVEELGYGVQAKPMKLARGSIIIHRFTKIDSKTKHYLSVDLMVVSDDIKSVWESREKVTLEDSTIRVVSRQGLIELKRLRGSKQDMADIDRLMGEYNER